MIDLMWPSPGFAHATDRLVRSAGRTVGLCLVCGRPSQFRIASDNLRDDVVCGWCGSFNRQRQLVLVLAHEQLGAAGLARGVAAIPKGTRVWNLEAGRALHEHLSAHLGASLVASEYLDHALPSGAVRGGVLHVDAQRTHFEDASLDVILSSDVLEHVPDVRAAIAESYRVLRPGGVHVFTAPFHEHRFTTERRATVDAEGGIKHLLPPIYHDDPVSPQGVLVYNIFGIELLCDLEAGGFAPRLYRVHSPVHGIFGANGIVFVARKPSEAREDDPRRAPRSRASWRRAGQR